MISMVGEEKSRSIEIRGFNKLYSNKRVFDDISLDIAKGEFICILGPNGCGKTTLMKGVIGLIEHEGSINTSSKDINYVGQDPKELILPWLTISANIIFPKTEDQISKEKLFSLLNATNLIDYKDNFPKSLSGGMMQILLIARSLMHDAEIILLDEPFKSLDFETSKNMRIKVRGLWQSYNPTIVMISHDIEEAIFMADRIVVLSCKPTRIKKVIQVNLPKERTSSIIISEEFNQIKKEVLNELSKK